MSASSHDLKDCVALVTGASRNIGRAIAVNLAQKGARIIVHVAGDVKAGAETLAAVEAQGSKGILVQGDLSQPETARAVVVEAAGAFGRLDILVNNAAIRPESPFAELSFSEWRQVMGVCLDAVFLVSQAALPHLRQSGRGVIINIGGLTGHTGASRRAHVITAKAGLVGLTKAMAHELAPGIRVNCVSPGLIETERIHAAKKPHHHASRTNLLGHRGSPQDVAGAVGFLCGPEGKYITGETLHVNGGAYLS